MNKQLITINKSLHKILFMVFIFNFPNDLLSAKENNQIIVNYKDSIGEINRKIFGNNFIAYDPKTYENFIKKDYYGYSDYGAGIWNPIGKTFEKEPIDLAKDCGIDIVRFPGGEGANQYNWKNAIAPNRKHFLYGIDEFIKTINSIKAEIVFTVGYLNGNKNDAADLIEYLNAPNDGQHPWALERAKNGHKNPYSVKYFEIGNELYYKITPDDYAKKYLEYYDIMKQKDPSIRIGVVLWNKEWNSKVMKIIKDKTDFGILHIYPSPEVSGDSLESMDPKDIFKITLAVPMIKDEYSIQETLKLLRKESGKNIPLAITEYNGGFVQERPVPYRHSLGTALVNAELLRIFLKPENNILMANYWQFNNSYWGMISNGFNDNPQDLKNNYFKRPNYYIFEMYHQHFGDVLLKTDVKSDFYKVHMDKPFYKEFINRYKIGTLIKNNLLSKNWEINNFFGVIAKENDGILEINFQYPLSFNYYHSIKKANIESDTFYKLSGYIKTVDLNNDHGISLEIQDGRGWNITHSAEETESISGINDWQYVEAIYKTLPDADTVKVIARHIGDKGPLKGKAYFKDVRLEKFVPGLDSINMAYLTVNASKSLDGEKVYLMVINKNMDHSTTASIELRNFIPNSEGNAWILNGPAIDATNENEHNTVTITQKKFGIKNNLFQYTFEPHSLTAIEIGKEKE